MTLNSQQKTINQAPAICAYTPKKKNKIFRPRSSQSLLALLFRPHNTPDMTKTAAIILSIFLLIAGGFVGLSLFQPPAPRPNVSFVFLGYTNNPAGIRMAAFILKNEGESAVE